MALQPRRQPSSRRPLFYPNSYTTQKLTVIEDTVQYSTQQTCLCIGTDRNGVPIRRSLFYPYVYKTLKNNMLNTLHSYSIPHRSQCYKGHFPCELVFVLYTNNSRVLLCSVLTYISWYWCRMLAGTSCYLF
jgi:hypothetical protein